MAASIPEVELAPAAVAQPPPFRPKSEGPAQLERGDRVGLYTIERLVARGGMGALYEASRDGRRVALKVPLDAAAAVSESERADVEERILREVNALLALSHPGVVRVRGFDRWPDVDKGYLFIVMDFVDGVPLYVWRHATRPSLKEILEVFGKLAAAVHEMHRLDICHRDLKSSNVLIRKAAEPPGKYEPIIVDFGISRPRSAHTVTGQFSVLGTYTHWAPEYVAHMQSEAFFRRGERFVFRPTFDLHALGFMLYECLTGKAPYPRIKDDELGTARAILAAVPAPPSALNPNLPAEVDPLVLRLLAKKPAERVQSGAELEQMLAALLQQAQADWEKALEHVPQEIPPTQQARRGVEAPAPSSAALSAGSEAEVEVDVELELSGTDAPALGPSPGAERPVLSDDFKVPSDGDGSRGRGLDGAEDGSAGAACASKRQAELPSGILKAQAQLRASTRRPRALATAALAGGLVLAAAVVAALASGRGAQGPQKPRSLLEEVRTDESGGQEGSASAEESPARRAVAPDTVHAAHAEGLAALTPAPELAPAGVVPGGPGPVREEPQSQEAQAAAAERPGSENPDEEQIRDELAKRYGAASPRKARAAKGDGLPAWLKRGEAVHGGGPKAKKRGAALGIPMGSHIRARLLTNLDSRSVGDGPVEAVLVRPHSVRGEVSLPSRTRLFGEGSVSGRRFVIRFYRLVLPDGAEVGFTGLALDAGEKKPGLGSARRIQGAAPAGEGLVTKVAKGAAATALNKVEGGTEADLAKGAGGTVLAHEGPTQATGGGGDVILLDAGADFEVFVSESF